MSVNAGLGPNEKGYRAVLCDDCGMLHDYPGTDGVESEIERWDNAAGCTNCGCKTAHVFVGTGELLVADEAAEAEA